MIQVAFDLTRASCSTYSNALTSLPARVQLVKSSRFYSSIIKDPLFVGDRGGTERM
jgi:hypothetical protein